MVNVDSMGRLCVQPHVVYMPHRIHINYENPKIKTYWTSMQAVFGKSQEENVNLYCP